MMPGRAAYSPILSMRSGPIRRISALTAVSSTTRVGMMPVTRPMKTSPPAWKSPMNHSAALPRAPKKPVGSSTEGWAAITVAANAVSGMIAPHRVGPRLGPVRDACRASCSLHRRAPRSMALRCRGFWAPPRPDLQGALSAEHLLARSVLRGSALHEVSRLACGDALGLGQSVDVAITPQDVETETDELGKGLAASEGRPPAERDRVAHDAGVVDGDGDVGPATAVAVAADADAHRARAAERSRVGGEGHGLPIAQEQLEDPAEH